MRHPLVLFLLAAAACGAPQTESHPTEQTVASASPSPSPAPSASAAPEASASPAPASPWDGLSTADLARVVTEGARARLAEAAPTLDLAALPTLAQHPEHAPELSGHAVERLLDLATVALATDHPSDAAAIVTLVRARARNRNAAYVANTTYAEAQRRLAGDDATAQQHAVEDTFRALPPMRFNSATVIYQLYQEPTQLTARLGVIHRSMVTMETAMDALFYGVVAPEILAHRDLYLHAIDTVRTANAAQPPRAEHTFTVVDLAHDAHAHPVNVAVWDLGVNPELFHDQLYSNPREQPNGRDDDGDGLVDDIHGIVADDSQPNSALLYDPGADVIHRYEPYLQGVFDLRAGLTNTPAAQQVLALVRTIRDPDAARDLDRKLDAIGEWAHGTHVAGLMLAGVPQARLAIFRSAWAGEARPYEDRGPTDEELAGEHANMQAIASFIQHNDIRVVNASLGFEREYLEEQLRHETARYHTDAEVRARAEQVHSQRMAFWREVFEHCPNTLFVIAAGNSNQDVVEYGDVPASIDAANVMAVGAVDRFGDWALFTNSNPERVRVFGLGVEVPSVIPDGSRVPLSGTSMASPNVANLAVKLFALDPTLTPARAIQLIADNGDAIAAPFSGHIADQPHTIAALQHGHGGATRAPARGRGRTR